MQPHGPWMELLSEAIEEYDLEIGGGENSVDHFIEWLAEWVRDARRRQRGLLLLTAHRAKGLEYDHVVVLDGGWDRVGPGEDPDAPRRLYYVAMTRARYILTLVRFPGPHRLQDALRDTTSVLHRQESVSLPPAAPELARLYRRLSLRDVFLSFAGYRPPAVIRFTAPLPLCHQATFCGFKQDNIVWNSWMARGRWWVSLPPALRSPTECAARLLRSWRSSHGAERSRRRNTSAVFSAMIGRS